MRQLGLLALFVWTAFAQSTETNFEIADVHASHGTAVRGPAVNAGRYEFKTATMVDLIRTAYGVDADKVYGGPSWLEMDRFDIFAKSPANSTPETRKVMLQNLLADRFKLVVHNDTKPMPAFGLTAGKHGGLKEAGPAEEPGCKFTSQAPRPVAAATTDSPMAMMIPTVLYTCQNMTMSQFAEQVRTFVYVPQYLNNRRVVDRTGLEGSWDFSFSFSPLLRGLPGVTNENVTIFDAMEKQLGLKLELTTAPMPVLVVDSVNRQPTGNAPDVLKSLPVPPTEFDVAEIKPSQGNDSPRAMMVSNGQPIPISVVGGKIVGPLQNGRVSLPNTTLKSLIYIAWDIATDDMIAGLPKFTETERFDVVAKMPGQFESGMDLDPIRPMLRALLVDRFKLAFHSEERQLTGYALVAAKPKLKPADTSNRSKWFNGPFPDGKDPRDANPALSRLVSCQNMTMTQFAELLGNIGSGYLRPPVLDATGLEGAWDFALVFSPPGALVAGGRGGDAAQGTGPEASLPNGGLSLFDALNKQLGLKLEQRKRNAPVMVIDHLEQKPSDN